MRNPKEHELKTDPEPFNDVWCGLKTFDIRHNDRGFMEGDLLILKETTYTGSQIRGGMPLEYAGREIIVVVRHILYGAGNDYGLDGTWVIMSIHVQGNYFV